MRTVKAAGCIKALPIIGMILLFWCVWPGILWGQDKRPSMDTVFDSLTPGFVQDGKIYLEVRLKPEFISGAKTWEERDNAWQEFFCRIAHEEVFVVGPGKVHCRHDFSDKKFDLTIVSGAVELQLGDIVKVRTEAGGGSARVTEYIVQSDEVNPGTILLAIAEPDPRFSVNTSVAVATMTSEGPFLVAGRSLPDCNAPCASRKDQPDKALLSKIEKVIPRTGKIPEDKVLDQMVVVRGHFTSRSRDQYVIYANFGPARVENMPSFSYWKALILDSDFSVVAVLGENEYLHIMPISVGDINGDGLDEIWVSLEGYEGSSAGLFYWRGEHERERPFGLISAAYRGS